MLFFCRHRTLSVQGRSFTVEKDQSKNKVHIDSTSEQDINSHLGSPLISHYIQNHIFSSKAKTCTNPDEKDILKNKEDPSFVPVTFALVRDQTKIQPDKLIQTSEISEGIYSPLHNILGPSTRKTKKKTEPKRLVRHQSKYGQLNNKNRSLRMAFSLRCTSPFVESIVNKVRGKKRRHLKRMNLKARPH